MSSQITFRRVSTDEARIYDADGDHVGDLYRQTDILNAGRHVFILHLDEDPRGPVTVNERGRVRLVAQRLNRESPTMAVMTAAASGSRVKRRARRIAHTPPLRRGPAQTETGGRAWGGEMSM